MSLYSDIRLKNKEKNSKNNKVYIRNQKFLNIVWAILFSIIIVADILYLIIENVIGVSSFTNIVMIIAIILEALSIGILIFYKFNTENIILKSIIVGIFAIPL
ncbi:MAG: hypothetical protein K6F81_02300, partial [Acholeplasmatales bacterium]|nr:hypothetical protein [Acholeplasmatales bacterium]